jgi:hypothetical protein
VGPDISDGCHTQASRDISVATFVFVETVLTRSVLYIAHWGFSKALFKCVLAHSNARKADKIDHEDGANLHLRKPYTYFKTQTKAQR